MILFPQEMKREKGGRKEKCHDLENCGVESSHLAEKEENVC